MWATIGSAFDLAPFFVDFLMVSSVSVPVLQFVGIVIAVFLLGLFLGRVTKRGVRQDVEHHTQDREATRVSLDFGRLTPLGPSAEEATEHSAMDLSNIRADEPRQEPAVNDRDTRQGPSPGTT